MKKAILLLLLALLIIAAGCAPVVLNLADVAGLLETEPPPLLPAQPIPDPVYETACAVPDTFADDISSLTNQERADAGLPELSVSDDLCRIAQLRALDMAENNYFEHTSPSGETAFTMLQEYGIFYLFASENIACGDVSAERIMELWMDSPSHRESILSDHYRQIGVGIVEADNGEIFWVQVFTS